MYIYVCVSIYLSIYLHICVYTYMSLLFASDFLSVYVDICRYMYIYVYICKYMYIYVCTSVDVCIYVCIRTYAPRVRVGLSSRPIFSVPLPPPPLHLLPLPTLLLPFCFSCRAGQRRRRPHIHTDRLNPYPPCSLLSYTHRHNRMLRALLPYA